MARQSVKVSAILDVNLHSRLCVASSLRGMTKNAILTAALTEYLKGIVAFDRAKPARRSGVSDRPSLEAEISSEGEIAA
jgi:hypothetical protein